jgi:hypothetical protein
MTSNSNKNTNKQPSSILTSIKMPRRNFIITAIIVGLAAMPIISITYRNWYSRKNSYKYKINGPFSISRNVEESQWEGGCANSNFRLVYASISNGAGITTSFDVGFNLVGKPDLTALYEISIISGGKTIAFDNGILGSKDLSEPDYPGYTEEFRELFGKPPVPYVTTHFDLPENISVSEIDCITISLEEEHI